MHFRVDWRRRTCAITLRQHGLENDCFADAFDAAGRKRPRRVCWRPRPADVSACCREKASRRVVNEAARCAPCIAISLPSFHSGQSKRIGQVRHLATDDVEAADDQGQQIVEIVRDAARQLPDRVHLLRLMQLLLKTTSFGHVVGADDDAAESAGLLGRRRNNRLDHRVALGFARIGKALPLARHAARWAPISAARLGPRTASIVWPITSSRVFR